ncbi:MAG: hypothetical protein ABMB14_07960 [Myxococcota bacterium]
MKLGNDDDELVIEAPDGTVIDAVRYDPSTWPSPEGGSFQLAPGADATDNDDGGQWCAAEAPFGDGDLGTPGAVNPPCPARAR